MKKLLLILLCLPLLVFSQTEKRVALVIGNANYDNGELTNPVTDARKIKDALDSLDFEVHYFENLTNKDEVYQSVREFVKRLDSADISFIYYSGHGIQVDGQNYLVPTKVELTDEEDVKQYCYEFSNIMRFLSKYDDQVNIVVLDACRNNRYESNWSGKSYGGNGLASMDSPDGCILAFSTKTGKVAKDNSFYAKYLSEYMLEPGLEIKNVFQRVRDKVHSLSKGKQTPVETHQMFKDYYLVKSNYEKQFALIDSLVEIGGNTNLSEAMGIASSILNADPDNRKSLLKKGNVYVELKDYEKALKEYNKAIKLFPNDPECLLYRGYMYLHNTKEYEKAIADFSQCIEIDSAYRPAYSRSGDAYLELENYDKALADFTKAIDLDKDNAERYDYRANCYVEMEDYTNALKDYDKAIDLSPENPLYYNERGLFYLDQEKYDLALKDFASALKIDPTYAWAINNNAIIYGKQGKYELEIDEYTKAIELLVDDPLSYSNRALAYKNNLEDYDKALADFTKAIDLDKENPERYVNRANCYVEMEDYTNALKDLDKAIDLAPENPLYYNNRADFYETQEKYDEALKDYATAFEISTDDYESMRAIANRANIYWGQEKLELSIEEYTKGLLIQENQILYENRVGVYLELEDYDKAIADYTKIIELDKENPNSYADRANCYVEMEDYTNALEDFTRAIDLDPENSYIFKSRANFYSEQAEYSKALKDLNQALKLDPNDWETHYDIASIYESQGKKELEIEEYTKAILVADDSLILGLIYGARSLTYQLLDSVAKAEKDVVQSLKYNPEDQLAPLSLLVLYIYNGKNLAADSLCNAQILIEREVPLTSMFYVFKGLIAYRLGKHDDAFSHLNTSLNTNDGVSEDFWQIANAMMSKIYISSKKYKEAKDICKKAIEEDKENIDAYYDLSLIYSIEEDPYESIINLNEVIELIASGNDPPAKEDWLTNSYLDISGETSLAEIHLKRGEQWNKLEKIERACKDFQKACDLGDCEMFNTHCK